MSVTWFLLHLIQIWDIIPYKIARNVWIVANINVKKYCIYSSLTDVAFTREMDRQSFSINLIVTLTRCFPIAFLNNTVQKIVNCMNKVYTALHFSFENSLFNILSLFRFWNDMLFFDLPLIYVFPNRKVSRPKTDPTLSYFLLQNLN